MIDSPAASQIAYTVSELSKRIDGQLRGPGELQITGVNALADAGPSQITFISEAAYARQWPRSKAGAAVVRNGLEPEQAGKPFDQRPLIFVADAEIAMIRILELFARPGGLPELGVHPSAVVHPTAVLGQQVRIGPHASIDAESVIGNGVVLHSGVRIYARVSIGDGSVLHSNVVVRDDCRVGRGVILHQNVSIGADGFGYRPDPAGAGLLKMPHIGNVIIEDGVEIGSNSCVDRAKFGSTILGTGTKIDNLCQIAHNCRVGRCCVIAGCTGLAGSVTVGDGVQIGGGVGIIEHLNIGTGARIGALALVTRDIPPGKTWLGHPADDAQTVLRQWASIRKLPDLVRRVSRRFQMEER